MSPNFEGRARAFSLPRPIGKTYPPGVLGIDSWPPGSPVGYHQAQGHQGRQPPAQVYLCRWTGPGICRPEGDNLMAGWGIPHSLGPSTSYSFLESWVAFGQESRDGGIDMHWHCSMVKKYYKIQLSPSSIGVGDRRLGISIWGWWV